MASMSFLTRVESSISYVLPGESERPPRDWDELIDRLQAKGISFEYVTTAKEPHQFSYNGHTWTRYDMPSAWRLGNALLETDSNKLDDFVAAKAAR